MEAETRFRRRKPAVERKIAEIREDDTRVSLIGKAFKVDRMDYTFWLDDGTGVILIESEDNVLPENGQLVRVIGRVIRDESVHIYGEVIQDFTGVDLEALEEIRELERKYLPRIEEMASFFGGEEE
ncbi:Replication factor A complex, RPA14 subunit [Thermococcus gammatolerans]|uniref:Replication factor A complex, RPA14 subunit n=1 Tax=Thermococcus gammatolerans (strain DSM 15229 / JCM 11827 / EJ3) TaxID=593117 RepID=C5A1J4_THEGJ|nr:Replication factor A complex, RPA14 subunit [Thermococcus gammatolerans]ACS34263.1 Replication factor A complex, RPA14 subunit [Thermococcus gammatolerans EJ3]